MPSLRMQRCSLRTFSTSPLHDKHVRRSTLRRHGEMHIGTIACLFAVLVVVGFTLQRKLKQELHQPVASHQEAETPRVDPPRSATPSDVSGTVLVPLSAERQRSHWTNPFAPTYWQSHQWVFDEDTLTSAATSKSTATFLQPYRDISLATAFSYSQETNSELASSGHASVLTLNFVNAANKPLLQLVVNPDRALLQSDLSEPTPTLLREVPIEISFGRGYLRVVLTGDRLLTFLDEHVLWNVTRPRSLLEESVFIQFETETRSVTLSEMRLDSAE